MNETKITKKCNELNMTVRFGENIAYIQNGLYGWRIIGADGNYELWHQNTKAKSCNYNAKSFNAGYHRQKQCNEKSIEGIINYIYKHDKRKNNAKKRKSRVDRMFDFGKQPRFVMF